MYRIAIAGLFLLTMGCAYNPPIQQTAESATAILTLPVGHAWDRALNTLIDAGYTITASSKESGLITTGGKYVQADETKVDCGNIWGLPFAKDQRTQIVVSYTVRLTEDLPQRSKVQIATQVQGNFLSHAGATQQKLECRSLGFFEKDLIEKINK